MQKDINFFTCVPFSFFPLSLSFSFSLSFGRSLAPGWPATHRIYITENDLEILISCLHLPHAVL